MITAWQFLQNLVTFVVSVFKIKKRILSQILRSLYIHSVLNSYCKKIITTIFPFKKEVFLLFLEIEVTEMSLQSV